MKNGKGTTTADALALPTAVADRLRQYQARMVAIDAERQVYLRGVFEALGIDGNVNIDPEAMTYQMVTGARGVQPETNP